LPVGASKYTFADELAEKAFNEWSDKAAQASLDLGQGARFNQQAANALRSVGIKPLDGSQLARNISAIGNNPSFAGNDLLQGGDDNDTLDGGADLDTLSGGLGNPWHGAHGSAVPNGPAGQPWPAATPLQPGATSPPAGDLVGRVARAPGRPPG
jgi:hypothetical protein